MKSNRSYVIDFDSTFTQAEALDVLGEISLTNGAEKERKLKELEVLTNKRMEGEISFRESLQQRLAILEAHKDHLPQLVEILKKKISPSFIRNEEFLNENRDDIYITSNGFKEVIVPVDQEHGIEDENVVATSFEYGEDGEITGFDRNHVLSSNGGQVGTVKDLDLQGDVY